MAEQNEDQRETADPLDVQAESLPVLGAGALSYVIGGG